MARGEERPDIFRALFCAGSMAAAPADRGDVREAGMMERFWQTLFLVFPIFLLPWPVHAEVREKPVPPKHSAKAAPVVHPLGEADGWSAYTYKGRSGQVCYITGFPMKREPKNLKRKESVMMVTHRPEEHVADVVSFDEGFLFKDGSDASLDIDGAKFDLFTKGDTAWSRTSDLDKAIVAAMAKGNHAVIGGTAEKGQAASDTYSLAGFSHALSLIDKACGVAQPAAK
jgi:Invasion associated locus B (IalB) protein